MKCKSRRADAPEGPKNQRNKPQNSLTGMFIFSFCRKGEARSMVAETPSAPRASESPQERPRSGQRAGGGRQGPVQQTPQKSCRSAVSCCFHTLPRVRKGHQPTPKQPTLFEENKAFKPYFVIYRCHQPGENHACRRPHWLRVGDCHATIAEHKSRGYSWRPD